MVLHQEDKILLIPIFMSIFYSLIKENTKKKYAKYVKDYIQNGSKAFNQTTNRKVFKNFDLFINSSDAVYFLNDIKGKKIPSSLVSSQIEPNILKENKRSKQKVSNIYTGDNLMKNQISPTNNNDEFMYFSDIERSTCLGVQCKSRTTKIKDLIDRFENNKIKLPPLQRLFTYDKVQMCNVIATILVGLSIDSLSLVEDQNNPEIFWLCDGHHRLRTIVDFVNNKFKLSISGGMDKSVTKSFFDTIMFKKMYNNKYFKDLPKEVQHYILYDYDLMINESRGKKGRMSDIIQAIMKAKNSCADPMKNNRISVGNYLLRYSIDKGTEVRTDCYVKLMQDFSFFSGDTNVSISESQRNKILNGEIVSESFHILVSSLKNDSDVEYFTKCVLHLSKNLSYTYYKSTRNYDSVNTNNALSSWIKHIMLCGYILTLIPPKERNEKLIDQIIRNLVVVDRSYSDKKGSLKDGNTSLKVSQCWKVLLALYFDKIDFSKVYIRPSYLRHSEGTKKLISLYERLIPSLVQKGLHGEFPKSNFSKVLQIFV